MVKHATLAFVLCACAGPEPGYPRVACENVHDAPLDPASYETEDLRAGLLADERATWESSRCDSVRAGLRPLDDAHDLEPETIQKECDVASASIDESIRLACRAGCAADRGQRANVLAWSRALKGVAAFDPKRVRFRDLQQYCPAMPSPPPVPDGRVRALWVCAGLPVPPKRYKLEFRQHSENAYGRDVQGHETITTKWTDLESMSVTLGSGRRARTLTYEECGGARRRWGAFFEDRP